MPATNPAFMTVSQLLELYLARKLSPVEVLESSLKRLDAEQPRLNPFCLIDREMGHRMARESEARWMKGEPKGRLDGIPMPVKDTNAAKGWPFRMGSLTTSPDPVDYDSPMVARLRENGAVFFGKTTTPEFGWKGVTDSPLSGITRNPWNPDKAAGGSSGGAAVSVATGIAPIAVAGDGGGSIRMPGGFSGVFGIKPTFGRVPVLPTVGVGDMSVPGPMSRTVDCAARMLRVVAGHDDRDPYAVPLPDIDYVGQLEQGVKGLRIGYSADLGYIKVVDPRIAEAIAKCMKVFEDAGAVVEQADPGFPDPRPAMNTIWYSSNARRLRMMTSEQIKLTEPDLLECSVKGLSLTASDFIDAQAVRQQMMVTMQVFHRKYDLLMTPMMPIVAFDAGITTPDKKKFPEWWDWSPFTWPFNMTRQAAATCPAGFVDGLPIGLHIVGPLFREDVILRAAAVFEKARPFKMPRS
jgi:aspartyl-tRNA(Asn)/glutamyl-tRNA(Gln) amidotransferase subunit A